MNENQEIVKTKNKVSYYLNGKLHRENGPAIEYDDGGKEYWINGIRHRIDGPAVEYVTGNKEYYINGELLTERAFIIYQNKKDENITMFSKIENLLKHQDFDSTESAVEFATKISLYYLNLVTQSKYTEDAIVFSFSKISFGISLCFLFQ